MTPTHDSTIARKVEMRILQTLKVRGFADAQGVADCTGLELETAQPCLQNYEDREFIKVRTGRISGAMLLPAGDAGREELIAEAREAQPLGQAVERLRQGDPDALAKPLSHSYHDVWMELHEDLLNSLGRETSEADGH